jgi:membrane-associated phospholipid phosphatase
MPRRARLAWLGAAGGVLAMALTWYAAHDVASLRRIDASVLDGFLALHRPGLDSLTHAVATLCDPMPYVLLAAVPVAIALVRGRPRIAVALVVLMLGAAETTELLKPLLIGARDPVIGASPGDASWPSGHATAAMALAMAMVISVPSRRRPAVGAVMAAFTVAVVYSFLELGWHYPSDVIGGFEVASVWSLLVLGALWTYEAHRPGLASGEPGAATRFSLGALLTPPVLIVLGALAVAAVVTVARPHAVVGYAAAHEIALVGAAGIAALSLACASALNLVLRRPS